MTRLIMYLFAILLLIMGVRELALTVRAQPATKPPIPAVAGPTTAPQLYSIAPDIWVRRSTEAPTDIEIVSNVLTIPLGASTGGNVFRLTNTADINSVNITGIVADRVNSFRLYITSNGASRNQTGFSVFLWPNSTQPTLTSTNTRTDLIVCDNPVGGASFYCSFLLNFPPYPAP